MAVEQAFVGGQVFEGKGGPPRRLAVAVDGGRIVRVGSDDDVREVIDGSTEVIDIGGRLLTPGFIDAHVHPVFAGYAMLTCELHDIIAADDCVRVIAEYAASHPEVPWIIGGGWSMASFPGGAPTRGLIDAVTSDRPVYLPSRDGHSAWVNSKALEVAGIDAGTPDPADGRIEREDDGSPAGTLHEGAMRLVGDLAPEPSQDDYDKALRVAQDYLFSLGITGWQDAILSETGARLDPMEAYLRAAASGELKARVVGALWWDRGRGLDQIEEIQSRRERGQSGRFHATSVKIMQDGVAENFTAAMLTPYLDACGDHSDNSGISFVDPETLDEAVTALDGLGFQVHFHAIGDRAVREALNAIEAAGRANGDHDHRHHIAHIQMIHPDDVPRFAALGVTGNMQPLWACHEPQMDELTIPFLGEPRWRTQYPFGALLKAGARLAGGSDWSVSSPDVLWGSHVAVNRKAPFEEAASADPFLPEQALDLATALTAYTQGSAFVNHLDDVTGTIEEGKFADFALLERNPFDGPVDGIYQTSVDATWIEGVQVFAK
jgi:predicted amidohydrolase YtcJ